MLFWILLSAVVIISLVLAVFYTLDDGLVYGVAGLLLGLIFGSLIALVVLVACWAFVPRVSSSIDKPVSEAQFGLAKVGKQESFLSYELEGGRQISYAREDALGAFAVYSVSADAATVVQDAPEGFGTVIIRGYEHREEWLFPWPTSSGRTWEFHIPASETVRDFTDE